MDLIYLTIPLAPLVGSLIAGLLRNQVGRAGAHWVTILGVGLSTALSLYVLKLFIFDGQAVYNESVYTWMVADGLRFEIGFLVDQLTALMMAVVTFVSLMVHVYTIGYMHDDPGYQRFFSYIALFTFAMLMLVMSNNFLQLFFGWEAVGLVSYLLIGFWFKRDSAIFANLKAFLVNRVGDLGFLLGVAAVVAWFGSLDYATVFAPGCGGRDHADHPRPGLVGDDADLHPVVHRRHGQVRPGAAPRLAAGFHGRPDAHLGADPCRHHGDGWHFHGGPHVAAVRVFGDGVVRGAGDRRGDSPGHRPDRHRAERHQAGRGLLHPVPARVHDRGPGGLGVRGGHLSPDDPRLLQGIALPGRRLGDHRAAPRAGHAPDGRVAEVHARDFYHRSVALVAFPGTSGFFSKEAIIEAVHLADRAGSDFAYWCVLIGVLVTALYSFRLLYLTFHGPERMDEHAREHCRESPLVVTGPLVLLAVPSLVIGWFTVEPLLYGGWFGDSIFVRPENDVLAEMSHHFHGAAAYTMHAVETLPFWLMVAGLGVTSWIYLFSPGSADTVRRALGPVPGVLERKYGFDELYQAVFARGGSALGRLFWRVGDVFAIDGVLVNGSAQAVGRFSGIARRVQSGYLYHYAFAMIIGLIVLLGGFVLF